MTIDNTQAVVFFLEHGGTSYNPTTENEEQGKQRGAEKLAAAETWAAASGAIFQWDVDDVDSSDFSDERPVWQLWSCIMYMPCADCPEGITSEERIKRCTRKPSYHVRESLSGIDFGRGGEPYGQPYQRVVEAELALEAMPS